MPSDTADPMHSNTDGVIIPREYDSLEEIFRIKYVFNNSLSTWLTGTNVFLTLKTSCNKINFTKKQENYFNRIIKT